jgi:NifU-like protein
MWDYSEKVMDHFLNPRNVGEVENADAVGEVGNITCGDALKLTLRIEPGEGRILDAKFKTFGCGSAIASSSALTEMIIGKTIQEATSITNQDIADYLDGLPDEKMHCSVMGMEALEAAITSYRGKALPLPVVEPGVVVCKCFGVTDVRIERVVRENNLASIDDVTHYVKAGGGCKSCHDDIQRIIDRVRAEMASETPPREEPRALTNLQRMQKVMQVIERDIRPQLQADGGDIELIDIDGKKVIVALRGACSGCGAANLTLYHFVQEKLREFVEPDITVEAI